MTAAQYNEFLNIIEIIINTNHDDLLEAFCLIGDWNAHIGRDSKPDKVIIGPHTMRQCTSARGKTLEKWLRSQQLTKTDTHFYVPRRGTWQHNTTKQWYELDGMVTPIGTYSRVQRIRTRPTAALSDHHAKEFYVHFTTLASATRRHANGFKHMTTENNTKIESVMTFFKALPAVTPRNITVIA